MSKKIINKSKRIQEYKKAIEIKEKQLSDIKKNILQGAKKSFDSVIKEKTKLKKYI